MSLNNLVSLKKFHGVDVNTRQPKPKVFSSAVGKHCRVHIKLQLLFYSPFSISASNDKLYRRAVLENRLIVSVTPPYGCFLRAFLMIRPVFCNYVINVVKREYECFHLEAPRTKTDNIDERDMNKHIFSTLPSFVFIISFKL